MCTSFVFGLRKGRWVFCRRGWLSLSLEQTHDRPPFTENLIHCTSVCLMINSPNHGNFSKSEFPEGFLAGTSHGHFTKICPFGSGESQLHLYFMFQSFLNAVLGDAPLMPVYYYLLMDQPLSEPGKCWSVSVPIWVSVRRLLVSSLSKTIILRNYLCHRKVFLFKIFILI